MYKIFILISSGQLFFLWVYLLLNRKKHDIVLAEPISEYLPYLTYGLVLTSSLLLLLSWVIYKTFIKPETSKRFQKITEKFTEKLGVFSKNLEKLNVFYSSYDRIYKHFGTGSPYVIFMMRRMKNIVDYSDKKLTIIIFSFVSLPRILVILVLLTEVLRGHLQYYFYSVYLLLIPLIFRIILFLLKDVKERSLPESSSMVIQKLIAITTPNKVYYAFKFTLKPEYDDVDPDIYLPNFHFPLLYFGGQLITINDIYRKTALFTQFFYYLVHVLCFLYIIFVV
jgi:hypothetical protein